MAKSYITLFKQDKQKLILTHLFIKYIFCWNAFAASFLIDLSAFSEKLHCSVPFPFRLVNNTKCSGASDTYYKLLNYGGQIRLTAMICDVWNDAISGRLTHVKQFYTARFTRILYHYKWKEGQISVTETNLMWFPYFKAHVNWFRCCLLKYLPFYLKAL